MRASTLIAVAALVATPAFAAPLPATRELKARLGIFDLLKPLVGVAGDVIGDITGGDNSNSRRELEARLGIFDLLKPLVGVAGDVIGDINGGDNSNSRRDLDARFSLGDILKDVESILRRSSTLELPNGFELTDTAPPNLITRFSLGDILKDVESILKREELDARFSLGDILKDVESILKRDDTTSTVTEPIDLTDLPLNFGIHADPCKREVLERILRRGDLDARISIGDIFGDIGAGISDVAQGISSVLRREVEARFSLGDILKDVESILRRDDTATPAITLPDTDLPIHVGPELFPCKREVVERILRRGDLDARISIGDIFGDIGAGISDVAQGISSVLKREELDARFSLSDILKDVESIIKRDELDARFSIGDIIKDVESFIKRDELDARFSLSDILKDVESIIKRDELDARFSLGDILKDVESILRRDVTPQQLAALTAISQSTGLNGLD